MKDESVRISSNRTKKIGIVTELSEKFSKANAIVFTNYRGITHKQLEGFKRAIKPLNAEYVVAKNSLLTIALAENKLKLEDGVVLDGQTGTLFLYDDVISPLKALAKTIKELNLPNVKFGIMDKDFVTGEQVLKLSTLPTKEVLLGQLVGTLKGPIFGLHRALNWNIQKLVMTLNAVVGVKPAQAVASTQTPATPIPAANPTEPESAMAETKAEITAEKPGEEAVTKPNITEPETIMAETKAESIAEQPENTNPTIKAEKASEQPETQEEITEEVDNKGGEN